MGRYKRSSFQTVFSLAYGSSRSKSWGVRKHTFQDLIMFLIWSLEEFKSTLHLLDTFHLLSRIYRGPAFPGTRAAAFTGRICQECEPLRLHLKKYDCWNCIESVLATDFLCGLEQIIKPVGASGTRVCDSWSKMLFQNRNSILILLHFPPLDLIIAMHMLLSWNFSIDLLASFLSLDWYHVHRAGGVLLVLGHTQPCPGAGVSSSMDRAHSPHWIPSC